MDASFWPPVCLGGDDWCRQNATSVTRTAFSISGHLFATLWHARDNNLMAPSAANTELVIGPNDVEAPASGSVRPFPPYHSEFGAACARYYVCNVTCPLRLSPDVLLFRR